MRGGQAGLDFGVVDDAALFEVDQEHLAGLQAPLLDDTLLGDRQHADLGRHHHEIVIGDDVARAGAAHCGPAWRRSGAHR